MHAVFVGLSGFPYGMAAIQRQTLLAKALIREGWKVTVVCTRSVHSQGASVKKVGHIDNILYLYLFPPQRVNVFLVRNMQKFVAPFLEFILLLRLKKKYGLDVGMVYNRNLFFPSIKYFISSRILNFKLIILLTEIYKNRVKTPFFYKINDYLFNKFALHFYDSFLPISHAIAEKFNSINHHFQYIPIIVDSEKFNGITSSNNNDQFFVYCGSASYFPSIEFILQAFCELKDRNCKLILVTNGSNDEMQRINRAIDINQLNTKVILKKNLSEEDLFTYYKSSVGLLLPLFDTQQDRARFPHKLAEYLASGRIVLSNPVGEITYYLKDKISVLFSPPGEIGLYSKNMLWVLDNPQFALKIGNNGKTVCFDHFDYRRISSKLNKFILEI